MYFKLLNIEKNSWLVKVSSWHQPGLHNATGRPEQCWHNTRCCYDMDPSNKPHTRDANAASPSPNLDATCGTSLLGVLGAGFWWDQAVAGDGFGWCGGKAGATSKTQKVVGGLWRRRVSACCGTLLRRSWSSFRCDHSVSTSTAGTWGWWSKCARRNCWSSSSSGRRQDWRRTGVLSSTRTRRSRPSLLGVASWPWSAAASASRQGPSRVDRCSEGNASERFGRLPA